MGPSSKVTLFPWDPNSDLHLKRLVSQRVECSWHQEEVEPKWKKQQLKGEKCIYWIVSPVESYSVIFNTTHELNMLTFCEKVMPLDESQAISPKEDEMLQDTATTINAVPRQPTKESFIPIGHISLDSKNPDAEHIELHLPAENVFWIKSFYVRQSIQGQGIGRAAMDEVEAMAVREPLLAKTLMLDTVQKDDQKREEFANATYGGVPKSTNEEWYARRGYRLIKTVQNYYHVGDKNGKVWDTKTVFMRKDIAGGQ
ncbi:hypothetical protein N7489_006835 [Penicillium chrysogenum]|uniref:N-acetyltransferase domain-containing protein n=1 Tax=Penicillium chrysogenum TaxID=5076 RepID=A0ABQ8W4S7_PENCH|nr:uncharacterized protein N7489_006835 [Penicillium chrysogenum]KAJ5236744.1 hypothetical protein N7489_006835 [Penicillium chrysogenum]KAJ5255644.1 hypothetical protein N7505_010795 [Penicillium chrysogenum]KAJ6152550.1 hypothetical protein N7497_006869 [Penicillium chrysogenum]